VDSFSCVDEDCINKYPINSRPDICLDHSKVSTSDTKPEGNVKIQEADSINACFCGRQNGLKDEIRTFSPRFAFLCAAEKGIFSE
jgi:hypothetical protein